MVVTVGAINKKDVDDHVVYQSDIEHTFACQLEKNEAVRVYAKLPAGSAFRRRWEPTTRTGPC